MLWFCTLGTAAEKYLNEVELKLKHHSNDHLDHVSQLYTKLNLLKLKDIYKLELAKFMHKIYNDNLPGVLQKRFCKTDNSFVYDQKTNNNKLFPTSCK